MKQCDFGVCTSRSIIVTAPQKIDNVNSNSTFNQNCLFTLTIVLPLFMMYTQYTHFEATSFCIRVHSMVIVCVFLCWVLKLLFTLYSRIQFEQAQAPKVGYYYY